MAARPPAVGLISLEPWDQVWRRNQHLSAELLRQGWVERLVFVGPPVRRRPPDDESPLDGLVVHTPRLLLPKRAGGLRLLASALHRGALRGIDVLWINEPRLGAACLRSGLPALYDVTDDLRTAPSLASRAGVISAAEDRLAAAASTVVCSPTLQDRWRDRYGIEATVIPNAVDVAAWDGAVPRSLQGDAPHVGYVGTLHGDRLDVDLVVALSASPEIGTVHLVGPDALDDSDRQRLRGAGVRLEGPVPAREVPGWMLAMDVLVSPHRLTDFTASLDAIKAREYAASGRSVVATPTSGFDGGAARAAVTLARPAEFVGAVEAALGSPPAPGRGVDAPSWSDRAASFSAALRATGRAR